MSSTRKFRRSSKKRMLNDDPSTTNIQPCQTSQLPDMIVEEQNDEGELLDYRLDLDRCLSVEYDAPGTDPHTSIGIDYNSVKSKYTHRGSLYNVTRTYKDLKENAVVDYNILLSGWENFLNMEVAETTHAMVDCIVEHWWDTTNTFHFLFGELGFTPLDWVMFTGLSIGIGSKIPYDRSKYTFRYVQEHIFKELKDEATCKAAGIPNQWHCEGLTVAFLKQYFTPEYLNKVAAERSLAKTVARAFFMYVLGQFFFSHAKNYVDAAWLAAFEDFERIKDYDWGGTGFASLYMSLNQASRGSKTLNGPFQILEFWGYEYLGILRPVVHNNVWPKCSKWKGKKCASNIKLARDLLHELSWTQVIWQPWEPIVNGLNDLESGQVEHAKRISNKRKVFCYNNQAIFYLGDRCWMQNHGDFAIPDHPPKKLWWKLPIDGDNLGEEDVVVHAVKVSAVEYQEYWKRVANVTNFGHCLDWEVEMHGNDVGSYKIKIDRPTEHAHIPPREKLSFALAYGMLQDYGDFVGQLRKLILSEGQKKSQELKAKDQQLADMTHKLREMDLQLRYYRQNCQPPLGFGSFSGDQAITDVFRYPNLGPQFSSSSANSNSPVQSTPFFPPRHDPQN